MLLLCHCSCVSAVVIAQEDKWIDMSVIALQDMYKLDCNIMGR